MAERIKIKITDPNHLIDMGIWIGYAQAMGALEKVSLADKLPGFNYALAKIQVLEARQRAQNAGHNIRLALKAGHDIDLNQVLWSGGDEIEIEPIDATASPDTSTASQETK